MATNIPDNQVDKAALDAASEPYGADAADLARVRILDVRRSAAFAKADSVIPGAQWRDPEQIGAWCPDLSPGEPVVVYCVYGHEVSRFTALGLRAAGVDARFMRGGIDRWKSAGLPLAPK